jgi:hypothetical protein
VENFWMRNVLKEFLDWFSITETIHFLHIGKNAGTQIKQVIEQINAAPSGLKIKSHKHNIGLRQLPAAERYFFSIRRPDTRFMSGFYSRKRKGQPRTYVEWNSHEGMAFAAFEHANDLAEALFERGSEGRAAMCAIISITHPAMHQIDWFQQAGHIFDLRPPVAILRQEALAEDIATFVRRIETPVKVSLIDDPVGAHANDYTGVPPLSEKAMAKLQRWYVRDYEFYNRCTDWIAAQDDA